MICEHPLFFMRLRDVWLEAGFTTILIFCYIWWVFCWDDWVKSLAMVMLFLCVDEWKNFWWMKELLIYKVQIICLCTFLWIYISVVTLMWNVLCKLLPYLFTFPGKRSLPHVCSILMYWMSTVVWCLQCLHKKVEQGLILALPVLYTYLYLSVLAVSCDINTQLPFYPYIIGSLPAEML